MKRLFVKIYILTILLNVASLLILPDKVAIHFSAGGRANSWGSKEFNCLIFIVIETFLFLLLRFIPTVMIKTPYKWINLPNKFYWLSDERKEVTKKKLEILMLEFGTAIMGFFLFTFLLTIEANLSNPVRLNEPLLFLILGLLLIFILYWTIRLSKTFRLPPKDKY